MVERNTINIKGIERWEYNNSSERLIRTDGREYPIRNKPNTRPRCAPRRTTTI